MLFVFSSPDDVLNVIHVSLHRFYTLLSLIIEEIYPFLPMQPFRYNSLTSLTFNTHAH